jgi:SAM-dependent methyltransferase
MTSEVMDWENAYREQGVFDGPPPWNIGQAQPELASLIADGKVSGDVLDAGCGVAELALTLAADGYTVAGLDLTSTAVHTAERAAHERGLSNVTFAQADITSFSDYPPGSEGRFDTIIDSTLFHSLPVESRDDYLQSIHRAAAPGAAFYALVFAKGAFPVDAETKPNEVDEDELRGAVSKYFEIDEIRPAFIYTNPPQIPGDESTMPPHALDDEGRMKMPAFLLSAHKSQSG